MEVTPWQRRSSLAAVMTYLIGIGRTLALTFPFTSLTSEAWASASWVIGLAGAMPRLAIRALHAAAWRKSLPDGLRSVPGHLRSNQAAVSY